jgi:hypothetical protein
MFPTYEQTMEFSPFNGGNAQDLSAHMSAQGYIALQRRADSIHNRRVMEAARLYSDALMGRIEPIFMREAMCPRNPVLVQHLTETYPGLYGDPGGRRMLGLRETMAQTDYQALFVDVLDRLYYGYYSMWPIVQKQCVKIKPLRDFRQVKRYLNDGMVAPITYRDPAEPAQQQNLYGPVPQGGAALPTASTAAITYSPLLGQTGCSINWAAFVNDDLGIFQDRASRLAIAANRGIARFITGQFFETSGPNTNLYTAGYGNIINQANGGLFNNPPLGVDGLADGLTILFGMKDSSGEPIMISGATIYLYYGSNNEVTAQMLANAISVFTTNRGGTPNATPATGFPQELLQSRNWLIDRVKPVMDPYVNTIASGNAGSWALVVDPNRVERPCVEVGFLNGFEEPQIFQEAPNTMRMGGGIDPMLGNFTSMDQQIKIVSVIGGAPIDGRTTVASNGSGS